MNDFKYAEQELWCEQVPVRDIAEKVGTPFYLYSHQTLKNHFHVFDRAFAGIPHIICFAAKSNSNVAILRIFVAAGGGFTGPCRRVSTPGRSSIPAWESGSMKSNTP
jgi:diaminopimelate decarboxylase